MRWLNRLVMQIRMLFFRGSANAALNEELRFHLEQQIAESLSAGMSAEEARVAALRAFGNPVLVREQAGATWNWSGLEQFIHDLRIGARTLNRTPGFALIAILITAFGIGASVTLFTVVRGVLLRPLPFSDPDRLVMLYEHSTIAAGSDRTVLIEHHEPIRIAERQRPKQHAAYDREQRNAGPDAKRRDENCNKCKSGCPVQGAGPDAQVVYELLQPAPVPCGTCLFAHQHWISERSQSRNASFFRAHPRR